VLCTISIALPYGIFYFMMYFFINSGFYEQLWYSGYGGETDVSLNCGRFYGPIMDHRRIAYDAHPKT
jgi:hypothetical protein